MLLDQRADGEVLLVSPEGDSVTSGEVVARAAELRAGLGEQRGLAFLFCDNSLACVRDFLALLEADVPVALLDRNLDPDLRASLLDSYASGLVIGVSEALSTGWAALGPSCWMTGDVAVESHPDLAVLLTTSGSTGSAKFVRLSKANVRVNAEQIVKSLGLTATDRGVTALPLFYSFGMSVVTSHILAGSSVLVTASGLLDPGFWDELDRARVTHLPGVPQSFAMLKRLGFADRALPYLTTLLQAGGRLDTDSIVWFDAVMKARGGRLFVMYGQTEAAPRIACLPPQRLSDKLGSAGLALQGGSLAAFDGDVELGSGQIGEIVYCGPNVMMGYASDRADLALGDTQGGCLRTGDLGYVDGEGFLFLTGREKRIAKLAGARVSLDEIEARAADLSPVAAVDAGNAGVVLFTTLPDTKQATAVARTLARRLRVAAKLLSVRQVAELPVLPSGKVDYARLSALVKGQGS